MPIPTDTFWNIKRLNWVFAFSAIALMAVTGWSIMQDHDKSWRVSQRSARVWDAAVTKDKIDSANNDILRKTDLAQLKTDLAAATSALAPQQAQIGRLNAQIKDLISTRLTLEFALNNKKSNLTVMEGALQDAKATNNAQREKEIAPDLQSLRQDVEQRTEYLANQVVAPLEDARTKLRTETAKRDEIEGKRKKLESTVLAFEKKEESLQPTNIFAKLSQEIRNAPLLDFVNPSEKVQQLVLPDVQTDVAFMKITTIDRCVSCHVNIANKEFTIEKVMRYLEAESARAHHYVLPAVAPTKPAAALAIVSKPGPVAMPEFWQAWTIRIAPDLVKKQAGRINTIVGAQTKGATITFNGQPITGFKYNPALNDQKSATATPAASPATAPALDAASQNAVMMALLDALYRFDPANPVAISATNGKARVDIPATADKTALTSTRDVAMRYIEELQKGLATALPAEQFRLLSDRYRFALTESVNVMRHQQGQPALDASPALLAHPRLDLYADPDSYHPMDLSDRRLGVGCTSCHDGSGQETDFVLAAHTPREIMVDKETGVPVPAMLLPAKESEESIDRATLSSMLTAVCPESQPIPKGVSNVHIELTDHEAGNGASHETGPENGKTSAENAKPHAHGEPTKPLAYVDPYSGKTRSAVTQMDFWKAKYEPEAPRDFELVYHEWDWPMRPPKLIQANCARCHTNILDIKEEAPQLYQGRQLFAQLGCVNCHIMSSIPGEELPTDAKGLDPALVQSNGRTKVGPTLTHITSKLSPAFINTWIWAPKAFRPSTKMPHFFMLENNSSDEEIRRTRQEARAITEYLVQTADPLAVAHPVPGELKGTADAGKAVFNSIGCQSCHANLNDPQPEKRGNKQITLAEKWIVTDLVKTGAAKKDEAEKLYDEMTYNERQTYVKEHFEEEAGATQADREAKKYSDGSNRPVFVHIGPELSGVGTKLLAGRNDHDSKQWLFDWLKEPRHYSPYTIMPRLRLSDQQAVDLSEYLLAQKRTNDKPDDAWKEGLCDVDSAKQIELVSLFLRSRYSAQTALIKADDDKELSSLAAEAIKRSTKTADDDKIAIAEADLRVAKMDKDTKRMVWLGKKLIGNYGCMSCHAINGTEKITSPCADLSEWGTKGVDKLGYDYLDPHKAADLPPRKPVMLVNGLSEKAANLAHEKLAFGSQPIASPVDAAWPEIEHLRTDWLSHKLKNTRVYDRGKSLLEPAPTADDLLIKTGKPYDKLKMPSFYLNDEQVSQLVTFVISNRDKDGKPWLVSDKLAGRANTDESRVIARGRELTTKFNCVSCHWIENNAPQIQQYYKADELLEKAPPPIRGEGNKVQFSWLFNFFKNVQNLRPLLYQHEGIRMPSFPATDDEWTAIIKYFNAVSNKESSHLKFALDGPIKYIEAEKKKVATTPPANQAWPGDDWYAKEEFAPARRYLYNWSLMSQNMKLIEMDPSKNSAEDLGKSYRKALYQAQFTIDLYASPYPFAESGQPSETSGDVADAHYKLGEELFQQMQCLSCHYLGDPNAAGAVKEPKAPNLSLAYQRLQRRWTRHWVQEPPVIQPNTKMPAFFSGLPVFNLHGQAWSVATGRPQNEIDFFGGRYGKTADEQANLVLDYLYSAGARGATTVQTPIEQLPHPPAPATAPGAAAGGAPEAAPAAAPATQPTGASPAATKP